jgi:23S rRNA pseudouridine1911/1915/1917 synthase
VTAAVAALGGVALHAAILGFAHPDSGVRLRFEVAPPAGWTTLLAALRGRAGRPSQPRW